MKRSEVRKIAENLEKQQKKLKSIYDAETKKYGDADIIVDSLIGAIYDLDSAINLTYEAAELKRNGV